MRRKAIGMTMITLMVLGLTIPQYTQNLHYVQAESVQYTYDSLGRVETAVYSDGTKMTYIYDKNGNIKDIKRGKVEDKSETGIENGEGGPIKADLANLANLSRLTTVSSIHMTMVDVQEYNKFKKRTPVIKSLKKTKKSGKLYLKIQIRRLAGTKLYRETGYEITYATNQKFKKASTEMVERNRKKMLTSATWKIKKNKTYYVKVRAYMKTKTGKKIYTKYSKVKKITVK